MKKEIIQKGLCKFYEEKDKFRTFQIPESLPLLENFCKERLANKIFSNKDVLFIQHCLAPFIRRIECMQKFGNCDLDKCWYVDIPYSTNFETRKEISKLGDKNKFVEEFDEPLEPYASSQKNRLVTILKKIAQTENELLVIDDGAYFVRTLVEMEDSKDPFVENFCKRKISIVEQTTRGHRYFIEKPHSDRYSKFLKKYNISVVSIAKSKSKREIESPFIGAAVSLGIAEKLDKIRKEQKNSFDQILVIGFGPVGKATTQAIKNKGFGKLIDVSENNHELFQEITELGAHPTPKLDDSNFLEKAGGKYDAVIGCTGYGSFSPQNVPLLNNGAILISASSAAIEFNRAQFLEKLNNPYSGYRLINIREIRQEGIHAPITLKKSEQSFSFLNAGFPANFDGKFESQPFWTIQLTHTLLTAASQQTLQSEVGFHFLNEDDDDWVYKHELQFIDTYTK